MTAQRQQSRSPQVTRRGAVSLLGAAGTLALLGCTMSEAPGSSAAEAENVTYLNLTYAYEAEPHDVRRVNRSKFSKAYWPALVPSPYREPAGTIVVDTRRKQLYLIEPQGMARRYGVAVGAEGLVWSGRARIGRKAAWPSWTPTSSMRAQTPGLPGSVPGGADNPLGARALYLYQGYRDTLYRIHGTSEPWTIGTGASSGCIRMFNEDVIDLFARTRVGAPVLVL